MVNFTAWLIYTRESTPLLIEWEAGWALEKGLDFWRTEKPLVSTGIRIHDRPNCSSVAIPRELTWFQHNWLKHEMYLTEGELLGIRLYGVHSVM